MFCISLKFSLYRAKKLTIEKVWFYSDYYIIKHKSEDQENNDFFNLQKDYLIKEKLLYQIHYQKVANYSIRKPRVDNPLIESLTILAP